MKEHLKRLVAWVLRSRPYRAYLRFAQARGPLLAAGIAYMGLFSITAILTVGWTAFSGIMASHPRLKEAAISTINVQVPGLLRSPDNPEGLVNPDSLVGIPGDTAAGMVALILAIVTGSTVIWYLGLALRSMFGLASVPEPIVSAVIRRILGLFALILSMVLLAVLAALSTIARSWVEETLSVSLGNFIDLSAVLLPVLVDIAMFYILVVLVASVRPPRKDLLMGALITAAGSTGLRTVSELVLGKVSGPVLTAAASVVTLMLWLNLLCWVLLYTAAWTSNPPEANHPRLISAKYAKNRPNYVTMSDPATLKWSLPDEQATEEPESNTPKDQDPAKT